MVTLPHFHIPQEVNTLAGDSAGKGAQQQAPSEAFNKNDVIELTLDEDIIRHFNVLRLKAQEHFVLVDPNGAAHTFELIEPIEHNSKRVKAQFLACEQYENPVSVTLVQGISSSDRMDQTIRQVTELGVSRIIPLESDRCTVRLTSESREKKKDRWLRIIRAAAEQSTCGFLPVLQAPCTLLDALSLVSDCDVVLAAWEEYEGLGIREALAGRGPKAHVALFVGPEGGFDVSEIEVMQAAGAHLVSLGSSILRTETAAVVGTALVLHELGELGNRLAQNAVQTPQADYLD